MIKSGLALLLLALFLIPFLILMFVILSTYPGLGIAAIVGICLLGLAGTVK